ncbi:hypothetical protein M2323_003314 [Rhodoblastus acidophilus]|uniref:hypothetical protein n=1 Tax=Rhodoblastus acidophilus TaxID=1074 RepID=UPI002224FB31|nr:hypothetical protein [Rhodoblastus acidophilus]MCW2285379.1 hypothetical protein [Rhodoblastus acidophilus]MCW2334373.1 hypothetical protein [Rhodoblastus acidophilus]
MSYIGDNSSLSLIDRELMLARLELSSTPCDPEAAGRALRHMYHALRLISEEIADDPQNFESSLNFPCGFA